MLSAKVFFVLFFCELALGAPYIHFVYIGVPCSFTNLYIPFFTYQKKKRDEGIHIKGVIRLNRLRGETGLIYVSDLNND